MCKFVKKMYGNEFLGRSVGPLDQYRGKKNFFFAFSAFFRQLCTDKNPYQVFNGFQLMCFIILNELVNFSSKFQKNTTL